jgi:hypothetical protein
MIEQNMDRNGCGTEKIDTVLRYLYCTICDGLFYNNKARKPEQVRDIPGILRSVQGGKVIEPRRWGRRGCRDGSRDQMPGIEAISAEPKSNLANVAGYLKQKEPSDDLNGEGSLRKRYRLEGDDMWRTLTTGTEGDHSGHC